MTPAETLAMWNGAVEAWRYFLRHGLSEDCWQRRNANLAEKDSADMATKAGLASPMAVAWGWR